jgi:hypothetical protein
MYEAYERFWHWLQTVAIVILLMTGLIIHRPDLFGAFSFRNIVTIHNVLAALLALNALVSILWHVVSGEIQQYIPHPYGFIDQMIAQAKYYILGIFKQEPHPFHKSKQTEVQPAANGDLHRPAGRPASPAGNDRHDDVAGAESAVHPNLVRRTALPCADAYPDGMAVCLLHRGTCLSDHHRSTPLEAMRAMVTGYEEVEVTEEKDENS